MIKALSEPLKASTSEVGSVKSAWTNRMPRSGEESDWALVELELRVVAVIEEGGMSLDRCWTIWVPSLPVEPVMTMDMAGEAVGPRFSLGSEAVPTYE